MSGAHMGIKSKYAYESKQWNSTEKKNNNDTVDNAKKLV